ncbi:hypothetical protein F5Y16DRAFT_332284 [Xylariaceae sp. FL0255]|nr:hypothetical protein F5Y16DRAFT_332284 [Xylariaceae sp. FL0255]
MKIIYHNINWLEDARLPTTPITVVNMAQSPVATVGWSAFRTCAHVLRTATQSITTWVRPRISAKVGRLGLIQPETYDSGTSRESHNTSLYCLSKYNSLARLLLPEFSPELRTASRVPVVVTHPRRRDINVKSHLWNGEHNLMFHIDTDDTNDDEPYPDHCKRWKLPPFLLFEEEIVAIHQMINERALVTVWEGEPVKFSDFPEYIEKHELLDPDEPYTQECIRQLKDLRDKSAHPLACMGVSGYEKTRRPMS